jgi:magnesium chelatase subunit D
MRRDFPFSAVVGQDELKLALLLVAVDPSIGGVLISGERGTAKSTAARGLAALLPKTAEGNAAPFVELPLGATEDRVVGSLDVSRILKDGGTHLRSGLLAQADGGVLYVDEVNLLPDPLVDLLLDAAAGGWVTVERDGVSAGESARFVLVGTMNPEEGELRPQFLDRFGLCVSVRGPRVRELRMAAIRQRLSFDDHPESVIDAAAPAEQTLRDAIIAARARLAGLSISEAHLSAVAALCEEHHLDGIRGDLAIIKTARALAAWEAAAEITEDHIRRSSALALTHRLRPRKTTAKSRSGAPDFTRAPRDEAPRNDQVSGIGQAPPIGQAQPEIQAPRTGQASGMDHSPLERQDPSAQPAKTSESQSLRAAPAPADGLSMRLVTDRVDAERRGRRGGESSASQHVVGVAPFQGTGTFAAAQSLVAAAARGMRVGEQGIALAAADLKQHQRRGQGACHVLFLVDASGSMATHRRLETAKGAAMGLLKSSYERRDEVALMVFRGEGTDLVLPFTRQVRRIEQALADVPTGGRTPLARALVDAADLLRSREPTLLVLLTDGRANVSIDGGDSWEEALVACRNVREVCAGALIVDCESGPVTLGRARTLARVLGAQCIALDALDEAALAIHIHRRLETL